MLFKLLHTKQLNAALKTPTSSRSRSIFSSNSWWEMCSSGNRTRSARPGGKYRSIQHTKISEIQTGIFGQMERAPCFFRLRNLRFLYHTSQHAADLVFEPAMKRPKKREKPNFKRNFLAKDEKREEIAPQT